MEVELIEGRDLQAACAEQQAKHRR
jgi:hypothetical protein